jgi:peptidoglycan/LPS O-acetylase OafA/YrhL
VNRHTDLAARPATLRYLPGLDGLRAISVLAVVVFHHYFLYGTERGWMPGGFLGVEVFFVVSGYLITSLLLGERRTTGRISLEQFWLRRARRLLPALFALLAVVIAYALAFLPDSIETLKGDTVAALTYTSNWWQLAAHRSYAVTIGRPELLKHLWSLAIEEQFYLAWPPLLMLGLRRLGRVRLIRVLLALAGLSTSILALVSLQNVNVAYYATFTRLSGLLLGSVMAFYFAPYRIRRLPGRGARFALDLAGIIGLAVLVYSFRTFTFPEQNIAGVDRSVFQGGFLLVDVATLLVIAAAVHPASDIGRIIGCRPLRWIGLRSYSLYLWHYPIFCVTRPRIDFRDFGQLEGWPVFVLRIALSFAAADLSYRYIESPIRNGALARYRERLRHAHGAGKRLLARRGLVAAGAVSLVAVALGAGLANAQPQADKFGGPDDGASADPSVVASLRGATTPPTTARTTGSTRIPGRATTSTTRPPPPPPAVLAIGDSVMLGAREALQAAVPGIAVDAVKSRQFGEAVAVLSFYQQANLLAPVVVVHLGTNGRATEGAFDQIMQVAGPERRVFFLTARVPRVWEGDVNETLHRAVKRWTNARVLEWRDFAGCHHDWFAADGFHLEPAGRIGYAVFVLSGIRGQPLRKCVK